MIAIVVRATIWTRDELAAQRWGAATQDALEHLALARGHARAETFQILRPVADQQIVERDCGRGGTSLQRGCLHPSDLRLEIAHEALESFLVLCLTETGQVRVDDRGRRTFVAEVDLDLAQVLPLLQKMRCVRVTQRMHMGCLLDAALPQGQSKSPLERGAAHWMVGRGRALAAMSFGRKQPCGVLVSFPERAQMLQGALWQGHVTVAIAFAGVDVQKHAFAIDVGDLQVQPFTQTQSAGVKSD